jgi:[protein-PII] uridylyltransferase
MIRGVLSGKLDIEQIVDQAVRPPAAGEQFAPRVPTEVQVDNTTSEEFTFVDVSTTDRLGVLYTITRTLFRLGLRIHLAKVTTSVDRVLDVFYVSNDSDHKVAESEIARIRSALLEALQPEGDCDGERERDEGAASQSA